MDQFKLLMRHWPQRGELKQSAYFYLFAFLHLVEDYGPQHRCWPLFGDVQNMPFWDWWMEREYEVFVHGSKEGVWALEGDEEIVQARQQGMVIAKIDISCPRPYLIEEFNMVLDEYGVPKGRGPNARRTPVVEPKWSFEAKPDVEALCLYFCVYILSTRKHWSHRKIADFLEISTTARENDRVNVIEATVSRYIRKARRIVAGLEHGKFPVYYELDAQGNRV